MAGLTDDDLRRIRRFVATSPTKRTPHLLTPDEPVAPERAPKPTAEDAGAAGDDPGRNGPGRREP
jgi:hypothetical protein